MRSLRIYNQRYDGSPIYRCEVELVDWGDDWLVWHARRGTPLRLARQEALFTLDYVSIGYIWLKRPYNVVADFVPGSVLQRHYCGVTLPPMLAGEKLTLTSLDLGLLVMPHGATQRLGLAEFANHRVRLGYPPDVETLAWNALAELERMFQAEIAPFDGSLAGYLPFVSGD
jgi:protein associated with RNAse G/E